MQKYRLIVWWLCYARVEGSMHTAEKALRHLLNLPGTQQHAPFTEQLAMFLVLQVAERGMPQVVVNVNYKFVHVWHKSTRPCYVNVPACHKVIMFLLVACLYDVSPLRIVFVICGAKMAIF